MPAVKAETSRHLTLADLDQRFGLGPTVDKTQLLNAIREEESSVTRALRAVCRADGQFDIPYADALKAAAALTELTKLADDASLSLDVARKKVCHLRQMANEDTRLKKLVTFLAPVVARAKSETPTVSDTNKITVTAKAAATSEAPTIDELRLNAVRYKTERDEDIVLTDGHVYYASGRPFDGVLSAREVRLLEFGGRLLAPADTSGSRTAHQFVELSKDL